MQTIDKTTDIGETGYNIMNATVEIYNGKIIVATTQAASNGDFVALLDKPLSPGDHQLGIRATGQDSKPQVSAETGLVSVPANKNGELLAMVMKPGEASRIVQKPAEKVVEKTDAALNSPASKKLPLHWGQRSK